MFLLLAYAEKVKTGTPQNMEEKYLAIQNDLNNARNALVSYHATFGDKSEGSLIQRIFSKRKKGAVPETNLKKRANDLKKAVGALSSAYIKMSEVRDEFRKSGISRKLEDGIQVKKEYKDFQDRYVIFFSDLVGRLKGIELSSLDDLQKNGELDEATYKKVLALQKIQSYRIDESFELFKSTFEKDHIASVFNDSKMAELKSDFWKSVPKKTKRA